jgi:hypothetical protein
MRLFASETRDKAVKNSLAFGKIALGVKREIEKY